MALPGSPRCARPLVLGDVILGGDRVLIAVATTGPTAEDAQRQVAAARHAGADVVELRLDLLEEVIGATGPADAARIAAGLLDAVRDDGTMPVILTVRTGAEGGGLPVDDRGYRELLLALVEAVGGESMPGGVALDVERARGCLPEIAAAAHERGIAIVASSHDFTATPDEEEILAVLAGMQADGADLAKIAVMPTSAVDVLALLAATARARAELEVPVVTMSMGERGELSRLIGGITGSALTFATAADGASAPGQPPIDEVRRALERAEVLGRPGARHVR